MLTILISVKNISAMEVTLAGNILKLRLKLCKNNFFF